jgi:hypothetical protein
MIHTSPDLEPDEGPRIIIKATGNVVGMEVYGYTSEEASNVLWLAIQSLVGDEDHAEEVHSVLRNIGGYNGGNA